MFFVKYLLPLSIVEFLAVYALALAPWSSLKKTWLRSQPEHTPTHTLAHTHTHTGCETDKGHFPLTNEQAVRHTPTQRDTERHSHTLKHSYAHLHAHRHTLLLLFVAQSCANDFQHIYNYCKCVQNFRHYVCVGVKERQRTNKGESESVLHLCASMCACKVNIRFYRLLLFAGLLQHATRESKNNREGEREREG